MLRILYLVTLLVVMSGCVSFPRDPKPPFPASIPATQFETQAKEQLAQHHGERFRVSVVHAAVPTRPHKGMYVYLLITANPPSEHLRGFARNVGFVFSTPEKSEQFVEIVLPDGRVPRLQGRQHGSDFYIGPRMISYARPGCKPVAEGEEDSAVVQLCMWDVSQKLPPGKYRIRLSTPDPDDPRHGWLWMAEGGVTANTEWKLIDVDYQAVQE